MKKAVVLLSGGIDSAVCAAIAKKSGYEVYAISFDYGQRHIRELNSAASIAKVIGVVEHRIITISTLRLITNDEPYVPARNTIFLSYALGYAETVGANDLFIGINADDSYFPDCSIEFFHAFNLLATVAVKNRVQLNAPLLNLNKGEIIKKGIELNVDFSKTISCYTGGYCGVCPACKTRIAGFEAAGMIDPNIKRNLNLRKG